MYLCYLLILRIALNQKCDNGYIENIAMLMYSNFISIPQTKIEITYQRYTLHKIKKPKSQSFINNFKVQIELIFL